MHKQCTITTMNNISNGLQQQCTMIKWQCTMHSDNNYNDNEQLLKCDTMNYKICCKFCCNPLLTIVTITTIS